MKPKQQSGILRLLLLIARAIRLRCPACGRGKIFRGYFTMHDACPHCGRPFQRGAGFFLGSIYFNYGITALLVTVLYFACFFTEMLTDRQLSGPDAGLRPRVPALVLPLRPRALDRLRRTLGSDGIETADQRR